MTAIVSPVATEPPSDTPSSSTVPDDARLHEHTELAPGRMSAPGRCRIEAVGTVAVAQQPRLAAGFRPRVARLEAIDERDLPAGGHQAVGERRPKYSGADDECRAQVAGRWRSPAKPISAGVRGREPPAAIVIL